MRWLVGWCGASASAARDIQPLGAHLLWDGPDPLWAVGDWRPDEIRLVFADGDTHLAVFGYCGATDEQLRRSLLSARAGALRQLTLWPGSYTAVARFGRRTVIPADLAGTRPVFHTDWAGGTAYATAALPLADLTEAQLDVPHLAALLACPDTPEAYGDGTPYAGVSRVPPGHALKLREGGGRSTVDYEPTAPLVVAAPPLAGEDAIAGVRDALIEAVRTRLAAPRHADLAEGGGTAPGVGADLSGGSASATLALLAAGLPGMPGTVFGTGATQAGERLLAVTFNDLTGSGSSPLDLERARLIGENPRLHHVVVTGGEEALPYSDLDNGPLTDEPGPSLISAARHRHRLAAGSADHLIGNGARQVLDAHPARLADLLLDRRRRHLLRPVSALAKASATGGLLVPFTIYRAARRLARTPYPEGLTSTALQLRRPPEEAAPGTRDGALGASLAALAWSRPGPAARWLTGESLAEVSIRLEAAAARPHSGSSAGRPGVRRARAALARHAADHRVFEQATEVRHQRLHAPFYDNQVVRACQALPESLRVQPGARAQVLRAVLEGAGVRELPPGWGTASPTVPADPVRTGMRANIGDLVDLFDAPLLADAGLIEARVVRKALRAATEGEPLPLDGLAELVSTELWLRRLLTRRGSCWTAEGHHDPRAVTSGVGPSA
ncbi:asparagine synthase-related protein [Streptomyces xiamenensis]